MAEIFSYNHDHQLLNIFVNEDCKLQGLIESINKAKPLMHMHPQPKVLLVEFSGVNSCVLGLKEWLYVARILSKTRILRPLEILLALPDESAATTSLIRRISNSYRLNMKIDRATI